MSSKHHNFPLLVVKFDITQCFQRILYDGYEDYFKAFRDGDFHWCRNFYSANTLARRFWFWLTSPLPSNSFDVIIQFVLEGAVPICLLLSLAVIRKCTNICVITLSQISQFVGLVMRSNDVLIDKQEDIAVSEHSRHFLTTQSDKWISYAAKVRFPCMPQALARNVRNISPLCVTFAMRHVECIKS